MLLVLLYSSNAAEIRTEKIRGLRVAPIGNRTFKQAYRRRVALCVGINDYKYYPGLECAVNDATAMASLLKGLGFDEITLLTDQNADKNNILEELIRIKAESHKDDLFVLYFAGHGQTVKKNNIDSGYLIPYGCQEKKEIKQGISMGIVNDISSTMPNRHILFLIDACYSGYGLTRASRQNSIISPEQDIQRYIDYTLSRQCVKIITAGGKNDQTKERDGHGLFTNYLLECMSGKSPESSDGALTTDEIKSYVKRAVTVASEGTQSPKDGYIRGNGDIVFILGRELRRKYAPAKARITLKEFEQNQAKRFQEVINLSSQGKYLIADQKLTALYRDFKETSCQDSKLEKELLEELSDLSIKMIKNELSEYYAEKYRQKYGNSELAKAHSYHLLGTTYKNKGNYNHALEYYQKALKIYLAKLGDSHPNIATNYTNIGMVYSEKGNYNCALEYYKKSLKIKLSRLGDNHLNVAHNYHDIGKIYHVKRDYDRALEYYQKALKIRLNKLGDKHPSVAHVYNSIGVLYSEKENYNRALEYYQKALKIRLNRLGENHPYVASSYNNIGNVYNVKGDSDRALEYHKKSLKIMLNNLGENHPDVSANYNNIGNVYNVKGDYNRALEYFQKALKIILNKLGDKHPRVAIAYGNIGMVYKNKKDFDRALEYWHWSALPLQ